MAFGSGEASAVTVEVRGTGGEVVTDYRWLLQKDPTYAVDPGLPDPGSLAVEFHRSYAPVVAEGATSEELAAVPLEAGGRYFLTVLPKAGYSIGGVPVTAGQAKAIVQVNALPLPTAQISVFVYGDTSPINNQPDLPAELGLEGFTVIIDDAGGRFGQVGGRVTQDAFGNPLGTTYDDVGNVVTKGSGLLVTDADGRLTVKNLAPGKYGLKVIPPTEEWVQTSTIEGTKTIDAWVKANEPATFTEFGPASEHVVVGFVKPTNDATALSGGVTLSGQVVNLHMSRPPEFTFFNGKPFAHTNCWVGLNSLAAGAGRGLYAQKCGEDGAFNVPNVPPGSYQLVFWDDNLDLIFASLGLTVNADGTCNTANQRCDLVEVPVFNWFGSLQAKVFLDKDNNGFRDVGEPGIPNMAVNVRFRDGTIFQSFTTDGNGDAPFDELFPFFHWLVAEVDYSRFKATGATIIVDAGGPVPADSGWTMPSRGTLNPQPQGEANPNTGNDLSRTETGPVLTQGFQAFMGTTTVMEFGKAPYGPGENGGISGIVYYATTRAENDPRFAAAEPWEPGIPRVQVNLYRDMNRDGVIDRTGDREPILADIDNYPFGWSTGGAKGGEDLDRDGNGGFDLGDAIAFTRTDSWDDSVPTGCKGAPFVLRDKATDCYDGLRNYNQARPAVFDGGYAFTGIGTGTYIVEATVPPGYSLVKEEDRNVDFGDEYTPSPNLLPPLCVGAPHDVPATLSSPRAEDEAAPFAGQRRSLCDRKQVALSDGVNAAADFFLFTQVPIAGHAVGFVLDDLANEFDPTSPQFGEKYGPPWIPVSIKDWSGREITRTYTDEWGKYNFLVPSTYTANLPMPSGMSPNMLILCMNDAGPIPDPANAGKTIIDPHFNRKYSQFCYTFQFMPGTTTYLDTPVVPVAAFAGPDQYNVDCELPAGYPQVHSVSGWQGGPYVTNMNRRLTIVSRGKVQVANPAYDGPGGAQAKTIERDYGFGTTAGRVTVGGVPLVNVSWNDGIISGDIAWGTVSGQLEIARADGKRSIDSVHVTVGSMFANVRHVQPSSDPLATPIQDAIDRAAPGDLILVAPGRYEEMPIMWKPVQLQGWGAGSTIINAVRHPGEKLEAWNAKLNSIVASGQVTLLPGQKRDLANEEGAAILVLANDTKESRGGFGPRHNPRIDGFTITGSDHGGGIVVNGYAHTLAISNNKIVGNYGVFGGGVRIGHPELVRETNQGAIQVVDADNDDVTIHHNQITQNGAQGGAGGGVSVCTGAENYRVTGNFVCGNITQGQGGGIGHLGLSDGGRIEDNTIVFNQSFNQGMTVSGGGVFIGGVRSGTALTDGSGSVVVNANHIQGNQAGAGDGGGIRVAAANGRDVERRRNKPNRWHAVDILNNMIVNNVAGLAGGGISLQDATRVRILHNTVAHNDSTATAGEAFTPGSPDQSSPLPAGIVSRGHSPDLLAVLRNDQPRFSNPTLTNNIVWRNRSFAFVTTFDEAADLPVYGLSPNIQAGEAPVYRDLGVLGTVEPSALAPRYSVLTSTTEPTNRTLDPQFMAGYFNGSRQSVTQVELMTSMAAQPAFDEGGNFVDVKFGPLTITGDYHLNAGSGARNAGSPALPGPVGDLAADIDDNPRPTGTQADLGADEWRAAQ